jgi:hypothetical protein
MRLVERGKLGAQRTRVEARILVLASEGRIMESAAVPGHWMIAVPRDPGGS